MLNKLSKLSAIIFLASFFIVGCSPKNGEKTETVQYLTIKGSDTMVHLASDWAETFMKTHPNIEISVTGGGSGTGIAALLNGTTDICIASRKIKNKEIKLASEKGISPNEIVTSRDGIAVVVNPENPIKVLSIEQIGKIYTGAYKNWQDVGGPDQQLIVLSRESSSGTYVFFQEKAMKKKDYTQDAMLMPSTSAIIQSVTQDKWAIGYVGLGYGVKAQDKVKMLHIKDQANSPEISPSVASVQNDSYSLARPLHFYTNGALNGAAKEFVEFVLSKEGQKIVLESGYVPVD